MKHNKKKGFQPRNKYIFLGITILIIIMAGIYLMATRRGMGGTPLLVVEPLDGKAIRVAIARRIDEIGSEKTYQELKKVYAAKRFDTQHMVAHFFGEQLYKKEGIKGITVCDGDFAFGCYHSFFGTAIAHEGLGVVQLLDKACVSKFGIQGLGCPHGIGHGLGEYLGPGKLNDQLAICATLTWRGTYFGCQGGVFMEYNFPTLINGTSAIVNTRKLDDANPYGPCTTVPVAFRPACYLELTTWWETVYASNHEKMGQLCSAIVDPKEKESCFMGIGYTVGPALLYDVGKTRAACATMPDANSTMLCLAGASWSFFANPAYSSQSGQLCDLSDAAAATQCKAKSALLSQE